MSDWNAKIVRVDQPDVGLLSLSLRAVDISEALVVVTLPGVVEMALVGERPRGSKATQFVTKLRRHVEGATLLDVERSGRAARLTLARAGKQRFLICATSKPYGARWLCETDGSVVLSSPGAPRDAPAHEVGWEHCSPTVLRKMGSRALHAHTSARKRQLERALSRHVKRLRRKRDAISRDLERAAKAEGLAEQASLLLAHVSQIEPGATHVDLTSWDDPSRVVHIELDPRQSPTELAQTLFAKSKRLKRGLEVAPRRLEAVDRELAALQTLSERVADMSVSDLGDALRSHGVPMLEPVEQRRRRRQAGGRLPYRTFAAEDGSIVLVGRGAADNDRLTLRTARPHDHWLHARGVSGAHVVVPLDKGKTCPSETLVDAATLAAYFSDLRGEPVVDVLHTPRRFVRKPKGSAAGSVTLQREKVISVRVESHRLQRLLQAEKKTS